ncbi:MAG: hypothetical protein GJ680_15150 [Alteromonadaceae bacterium]|nr:hypothetical protein [Alteromonadaceae bacterium]
MGSMRQGKIPKLYLIKQGLIASGVFLSLHCAAFAQSRDPNDPWWFEVETIIFKRNYDPSTSAEQYPLIVSPVARPKQSYIEDYLYPDTRFIRQSLPNCSSTAVELPKQPQRAPVLSGELMFGSLKDYAENTATADLINQTLLTEQLSVRLFNDIEQVVATTPMADLQSSVADAYVTIENEDLSVESDIRHWPPYTVIEAPWTKAVSSISSEIDVSCYEIADSDRLFIDTSDKAHWQSIPIRMNGQELPFSDVAYILPIEELQLTDLYRQISRRRGITPMLHIAWRQEVKIGRDNAPFYRVMAGKNFNDEFTEDFRAISSEMSDLVGRNTDTAGQSNQALVDAFSRVLLEEEESIGQNDNTIELDSEQRTRIPEYDLWELDGQLKVFIEYLGSTPYLHVDSLFDYRIPVVLEDKSNEKSIQIEAGNIDESSETDMQTPVPNFLQSLRFDQLRRVISTEIHYFDHPAFGMVLQVRRYRRPAPEELEE